MIPEETFKQLLDIEEELPGAVVSGGFLRDTLLGAPIKDIDIIVSAGAHDLHSLGFIFQESLMEDCDYQHDRIHAIWNRGVYNVIEVVGYVSADEQNRYNDIGLCKISWSLNEGLIMAPEFIKDVLNQTLTVCRTGWGEEGVRKHLTRLKAKYPGYVAINN